MTSFHWIYLSNWTMPSSFQGELSQAQGFWNREIAQIASWLRNHYHILLGLDFPDSSWVINSVYRRSLKWWQSNSVNLETRNSFGWEMWEINRPPPPGYSDLHSSKWSDVSHVLYCNKSSVWILVAHWAVLGMLVHSSCGPHESRTSQVYEFSNQRVASCRWDWRTLATYQAYSLDAPLFKINTETQLIPSGND